MEFCFCGEELLGDGIVVSCDCTEQKFCSQACMEVAEIKHDLVCDLYPHEDIEDIDDVDPREGHCFGDDFAGNEEGRHGNVDSCYSNEDKTDRIEAWLESTMANEWSDGDHFLDYEGDVTDTWSWLPTSSVGAEEAATCSLTAPRSSDNEDVNESSDSSSTSSTSRSGKPTVKGGRKRQRHGHGSNQNKNGKKSGPKRGHGKKMKRRASEGEAEDAVGMKDPEAVSAPELLKSLFSEARKWLELTRLVEREKMSGREVVTSLDRVPIELNASRVSVLLCNMGSRPLDPLDAWKYNGYCVKDANGKEALFLIKKTIDSLKYPGGLWEAQDDLESTTSDPRKPEGFVVVKGAKWVTSGSTRRLFADTVDNVEIIPGEWLVNEAAARQIIGTMFKLQIAANYDGGS